MSLNISELPWLLRRTSAETRLKLRELLAAENLSASQLIGFANQYLNADQLVSFAKALPALRDKLVNSTLVDVRLAVLSSSTTDYLKPALAASGIRHGLSLHVTCADYGQVMQEAFSTTGVLASAAPEVVLLALDRQFVGLVDSCTDESQSQLRIDAAAQQIQLIVDSLKANYGATVVLQTIPTPPDPWLGHLDCKVRGSLASQVAQLNSRIIEIASATSSLLIDADRLSALVGHSNWMDRKQWFMAKVSVSMAQLPFYADHVARTLAAMKGKTKKCLVLDLDNTLWGGVIADDGLEGISLGQGSATGEAFVAIQEFALEMKKRGVILAVCSKNDEHNARLPFNNHPEMLLKADDIAVFVANWTDKATNLRGIAEALNIGIDSLVFLDDNPAERSLVRREVPEVAVPEVTDDPSLYPTLVAQAGYFESVSFTSEDLIRTVQYLHNAKRVEALKSSAGLPDFLRSLEMTCEIKKFDAVGRARITQLINKSNQFNLTTRRYTENQVEEIEASQDRIGLQVRLLDKFGDNGMISVIILDKKPLEWTIDTWLMSCRVLGREVEQAVLQVIVELAQKEGVQTLVGVYLPTPKNSMVREHYGKLGFTRREHGSDAGDRWELDLNSFTNNLPLPMELTGIIARERHSADNQIGIKSGEIHVGGQ